jgi:LytR cell envelope-related transcriptional attenuator
MDLLKEIGAILGFVAFGGFAVLVFMTFQQARHLRRLREWAGRAPERAAAEQERSEAASEATMPRIGAPADTGSQRGEPAAASGPGRGERLRGEVAYRYEELDKRSPVSPLVLGLGILALVVAAVIVTGGFGLLGSDSGSGSGETTARTVTPPKPEVAVLNGTAPEGGVGVPGTAKAASVFVKDAGWKVGEVGDAGSFPTSSVMFEGGFKSDAEKLASDLSDQLGDLEVVAITSEVQDVANGADLAVVVGQDDQGIAG